MPKQAATSIRLKIRQIYFYQQLADIFAWNSVRLRSALFSYFGENRLTKGGAGSLAVAASAQPPSCASGVSLAPSEPSGVHREHAISARGVRTFRRHGTGDSATCSARSRTLRTCRVARRILAQGGKDG